MDLAQHADVLAGGRVDRHDGLEPELDVLAEPDDAGIDRAGGPGGLGVVGGRLQRQLDDRDHPTERLRQADVAHVALQVLEIVLKREAPLHRGDVLLAIGRDGAVGLGRPDLVVATRRERQADGAGEGKRLDVVETVRQIAEPLAEEQRGRDRVERLGAHLLAAGASDIPAHAGGDQGLVLLALEEDVLQRDLHVVEAGQLRASVGIEDLVGAAEREAEVAAQALGELGADGRVARGRRLVVTAQLDVRDRGQRQLVGDERIVDRQRRRKEPLADEAVGLSTGRREGDQRRGRQ